MENKRLDLKCNTKEDNKRIYLNGIAHEVKGCGEEVSIDLEYDAVFAAREKDYWDEDILKFYWVCPLCGMIHILNEDMLTYEEQLEIMRENACIADEVYQYYLYEKIRKDLKKEMSEIENLQNGFSKKMNFVEMDSARDTSRLYPNWEESDMILKRRMR